MRGSIFYLPIEKLITPIDGEVLCNRWWTVHPVKGLAFYYVPKGYYKTEEPSPQCNRNKYITEHFTRKIHPGHIIEFYEVIFFQHAIEEMKRLIKK